MNLAKYDSIVFTSDSLQRVLEWGDANKALFHGDFVIPEGVIEVTGEIKGFNNPRIYFKVNENFVTIKLFNTESIHGEHFIQHFEVYPDSTDYVLIEVGSRYQKLLNAAIPVSKHREHLHAIQTYVAAFFIYVNVFMIYFENSEFVNVKEVRESHDTPPSRGKSTKKA